nr:hypothetical protein [Tanacetum cinerariifolium]
MGYLHGINNAIKVTLFDVIKGSYEFKVFTPSETEAPRMQKEEDLRGDDMKHYKAKIKAINLILISISNEIYNSIDACTPAKAMWQRIKRDTAQNNYDDPLTSAIILFARAITRNFSNPTNNHLRTSSNTINQAIVQGDRVNIQSKNSSNNVKNTRRSYVQEEVIESNNVQNDAGNIQRTLRTASSGTVANVQCYNCNLEQQRDKLDLNVVELKSQTVELQKTQSILKRKMSENKDQYHDTVLDLKAKVKKDVGTVLKIGNSLQGMLMLGPKPIVFYYSKLKLGYANPYTLKKAISQNPKLYDASCLDD